MLFALLYRIVIIVFNWYSSFLLLSVCLDETKYAEKNICEILCGGIIKKENKLVLLRFNKVRQTTEIKDGLYFFFMGLGSCLEKLKSIISIYNHILCHQ